MSCRTKTTANTYKQYKPTPRSWIRVLVFGKFDKTKNTKDEDQQIGYDRHWFKNNVTKQRNICVIKVQTGCKFNN